jgi:hypothetical protein
MTLTLEQTARSIYYLKVARQRLARSLADSESLQPGIQLEYSKLDELIQLFQSHLETLRP